MKFIQPGVWEQEVAPGTKITVDTNFNRMIASVDGKELETVYAKGAITIQDFAEYEEIVIKKAATTAMVTA